MAVAVLVVGCRRLRKVLKLVPASAELLNDGVSWASAVTV